MKSKIKSISLGLENCEDISIDKEYIYMLSFDNVTEGVYYDPHREEICRYMACEDFFLELGKKADKTYDSFGSPSEQTAFRRIQLGQDITSCEICYEDGRSELIYVPFDGDERNAFQTSCIRETGRLFVCIGRDKLDTMFE